jgi:hypothetical protein
MAVIVVLVVVNKVELVQTVLEPSVSLSIIIPQILHINIYVSVFFIWGLIVAQLETAVPQRHVLPHHKESNIKSVVITM